MPDKKVQNKLAKLQSSENPTSRLSARNSRMNDTMTSMMGTSARCAPNQVRAMSTSRANINMTKTMVVANSVQGVRH